LISDDRAIGEAFNIGAGREISMIELATAIIEMSGSSSEIKLMTYEEAFPTGGFEDMRRRVPDTSKITAMLGWRPQRSLEEILMATIAEARTEKVV
jgi:UDP-glucose 4-epimerase